MDIIDIMLQKEGIKRNGPWVPLEDDGHPSFVARGEWHDVGVCLIVAYPNCPAKCASVFTLKDMFTFQP